MADVEHSLECFTRQAIEHRAFVCITPSPEAIPIPADWRYLGQWVARHGSLERPPSILASVKDAVGYVKIRLQSFLEVRFAGSRMENVAGPGTGFDFTVHTETSGLRVHYTDAYFLDSTRVFNAPTTPVKGTIVAGRYIFGAAVPGSHPVFDFDAEYEVPSQSEALLSL